MKGDIHCPKCDKIIGKYEDVIGRGDLYLYCKRCRKEVRIPIEQISIDR